MFFKKQIIFYVKVLTSISFTNFAIALEIHDSAIRTCAGHKESAQEKENKIFGIGGQVRLRGDFVKNQNLADFSFSPDTHDEQIVSRTRLNLSFDPASQIKGFVQGQFYMRQDHSDYSKANLYQAYLELSNAKPIPLSLKIGRQDFCYGSAFFLGTNDFYDGLTWDGLRLKIRPGDNLWIDLIGARYVKLNKHTSDDEPALYGTYSSYKLNENTDIDLYFFYHKGGFKFFHSDLPDSPRWFTLGNRIAGKIQSQLDYEIEPLYQFGKIDNPNRSAPDAISAYGGHIEAGYKFKSKYNPRLFAAYAFGSGDNDTQDKRYQEFHGNVYNDNYLVGDISLISDLSGITVGGTRASGMHVLVAGLSVDVNPKLNLNFDYHYFQADKTPLGISKAVGGELNLIATYKLAHNMNIVVSSNRFFTGKFFEDAGSPDKGVDYFYLQTEIAF